MNTLKNIKKIKENEVENFPRQKEKYLVIADVFYETADAYLIDDTLLASRRECDTWLPKSQVEVLRYIRDDDNPALDNYEYRYLFSVPKWMVDSKNLNIFKMSQIAFEESEKRRKQQEIWDAEKRQAVGYIESDYKTKYAMVKAHKELLLYKTRNELTYFGKLAGCDSRSGFSAYKRALKKIGIDYDALAGSEATLEKPDVEKQEAEQLVEVKVEADDNLEIEPGVLNQCEVEKINASIRSSEKLESNFNKNCEGTVLDKDGNKIISWVNRFDKTEGTIEIIKDAIDYAVQTKNHKGWLLLEVTTDLSWLCHASNVFIANDKSGGQARTLGYYALVRKVKLNIIYKK